MNTDNSIAILETSKQPFSAGQEPAVLIASTDITERRQAEETLRKSESRQGKMVANIGDVIVIIDPDGVNRYKSPNIEKWFGWRPEEVVGCQTLDNVHPEDVPAAQAFLGSLLAVPGASATTECRYRCKNGEYKWIEFTGVNLVSDPDIQGILGNYHDITKRRRAEEALRQSESLLNRVQSIAKLGAWEWELVGQKMFWSDETYRIHDLDSTDLVPDAQEHVVRSLECYSGEDRTRIQKAFRRCMEHGESYELESRFTTAKGRDLWIRTAGSAVKEAGQIVKVIGDIQDITERKRAEEALMTEQIFSKTVIDSIPGAFYVIDDQGRYARWNAYQRDEIVGKPEEKVAETHAIETIHPDDRERIQERIVSVMKSGADETVEARVLLRGGPAFRWLLMTGRRIIVNGHPFLVGIGVDITERKQVEENLIEITERLNLALTSARAGVWDWNLKTNEMFWDDRMLDLYGIRREGFSGGVEAWEQGLHPEDSAKALEECQAALRGEQNFDTEFRVRRRDGTVIHVKANGLVERDEEGKPVRMIGLNTDITDRKQQEERIALLGRMLDNAPAAITIHDRDGHFVFANVEAVSLHGYDSIEAFLQVNLHELDVPESEALLAERLRKITEEEEARFEVEHYRKDGSRFPLAILAKSIEWEGHPAVLSIATDISMHKEAEREKEKLLTQFIHAQKMESIGRLAGGVAHDFNNMLQVILGNAERSLADLPSESPVRESLQEIQTCAQRSATLTRQLLAFARKQTIAPKVLDLNEAVEGMLKMLRRLIGEDVKLLWQPGTGSHTLMMDPSQIDQILANLCVNARDAIVGTGKIVVETDKVRIDENYVSQHEAFVPGDYIRLVVSDTGCGMTAETLANVFEPFFTTKANKGGTGLGLATVYGIVKQNKGFIDLYSEVGQGTTIKIYLPYHVGTVESFCKKQAVEIPGSGTILLVEDEVAILEMTRRCLERLGYTVLAASTPNEALGLARKHEDKIALLLTDVIMPEMNGRDLSQSLEALQPSIKTLFMSGYTADVIALQGVLEEGVCFLQKPFSMADLSVKIREVLGEAVSDAKQGFCADGTAPVPPMLRILSGHRKN